MFSKGMLLKMFFRKMCFGFVIKRSKNKIRCSIVFEYLFRLKNIGIMHIAEVKDMRNSNIPFFCIGIIVTTGHHFIKALSFKYFKYFHRISPEYFEVQPFVL